MMKVTNMGTKKVMKFGDYEDGNQENDGEEVNNEDINDGEEEGDGDREKKRRDDCPVEMESEKIIIEEQEDDDNRDENAFEQDGG
eukprot:gene6220-11630_t